MSDIATCPTCRQTLRVPPSLIGRRVKCPACTTDFDPVLPPPMPSTAPVRFDDDRPPRRDDDYDRRDDDRDRRPRRDDDEDYDRPRRSRRGEPKPGKVQAVAIMMLVGGILNCLIGASIVTFSCGLGFLWPGTYLAVATGILCIIKASALLGDRADAESPPIAPAVMQIVCVINGDLINLTLGIVELVMLNDPEVRRYLRP